MNRLFSFFKNCNKIEKSKERIEFEENLDFLKNIYGNKIASFHPSHAMTKVLVDLINKTDSLEKQVKSLEKKLDEK